MIKILVAPSWNKNRLNFINEDFEEILKNLLNSGLLDLDLIQKQSKDHKI